MAPPTSTARAGCPRRSAPRAPTARCPSHASATAFPNRLVKKSAATTNGTAAIPTTVMHNSTSNTGVSSPVTNAATRDVPGCESSVCTHRVTPSRNSHARPTYSASRLNARPHAQPRPGARANGPPIDETMVDPRLQPPEPFEAADHRLHRAAHLRGRIPIDLTADRDHVARNLRVGAELDVPEHRDHVAVDGAVDDGVAEDRDRGVAHRSGDRRIAHHRHHVRGVPLGDGRTEHRHHRIGPLACRQVRAPPNIDQVVPVSMREGVRASPPCGILVLVIAVLALRPIRIAVGTVRRCVGVFMVIAIRGGRRRCGFRDGGTLGRGSRLQGPARAARPSKGGRFRNSAEFS